MGPIPIGLGAAADLFCAAKAAEGSSPRTVELRVTMDKPALECTVSLSERPMERLMNLASAPMPVWSWRPRMLRAPREWLAHWALGMGHVQLDGPAAAGMPVVMMPSGSMDRRVTSRVGGGGSW